MPSQTAGLEPGLPRPLVPVLRPRPSAYPRAGALFTFLSELLASSHVAMPPGSPGGAPPRLGWAERARPAS